VSGRDGRPADGGAVAAERRREQPHPWADKFVVLVGTKRALAIAVKNDKTESRFTQLAARLGARV
jgi:hypothetical protein